MLLFADGFENCDSSDLHRKWDEVSWANATNTIGDFEAQLPNKRISAYSGGYLQIIKNNARKGERCLVLYERYGFSLMKKIRKSRTLFVGFAQRIDTALPIKVHFYSGTTVVATCTITPTTNAIQYAWVFASGIDTQTVALDISKSPYGIFLYHQIGITLYGNVENDEDCTAWVDHQVTSNAPTGYNKVSGIRTCNLNSTTPFWFDSVKIERPSTDWNWHIWYLDDVYICNDEGSYNNTFLGDVRIRAMNPENVGSINNASMIGFEGSRHLGVSCDFINTYDEIPETWPYDEYPNIIEYSNPFNIYLRMNDNGQQLFKMSNPDYHGSEPNIVGCMATVICKAYRDTGKHSRLELLRKSGYDPVEISESRPMRKPIGFYNGWEVHTLAIENTEELVGTQQSQIWTPDKIGSDEWGLKVVEWGADPSEYLTGFLRDQLTHDEILYDYLDIPDFAHRHWDREIIESVVFIDFTSNSWAHYLRETIDFLETLSCYKRFHKGLDETLYAVDSLPWYYIYLKEVLGLDDEMVFTYGGTINETMGLMNFSYHEWVEELTSPLYLYSSKASSDDIINVFDVFSLTEPLVWDNHETVEDAFEVFESYLWTNHEAIIDYLSYDAYSFAGWGAVSEDGFNIEEDHFNGHWVEQIEDGMKAWFEGITQQWRYEWFIGVIISSTRIAPIEDTGQWGGDGLDGDKTGYNSW